MPMEVVRRFGTPLYIGQARKGLYYVNLINAIKVDDNLRTIWLNLKITRFKKNITTELTFPISRYDEGSFQDFKLTSIPTYYYRDNDQFVKYYQLEKIKKFLEVFVLGSGGNEDDIPENIDLDKNIRQNSIIKRINILSNLDNYPEEELHPVLLKIKQEMNDEDKITLKEFKKLLESNRIPRKNLNELLKDENYTLLLGELDSKEKYRNITATESASFYPIPMEDIERLYNKHFAKIIMDEKLKINFFKSMGFEQWLNGQKPEFGGLVLIDFGGTGKSLLKKALSEFMSDLEGIKVGRETLKGGFVKEKNQGDISSYSNSGPQTIQRWYRGSNVSDHISGKEEDLVKKARENHIPSILIVDEAADIIKSEDLVDRNRGKAPLDTINSLKRFVQEVDKGGVVGYVVTLFIANMLPNEIDKTLVQGGERLTEMWVGQPRTVEVWTELLNLFIKGSKKIDFNQNTYRPEILGELLIGHLELVQKILNTDSQNAERYGVSQRMLGDFVNRYDPNQNNQGENHADALSFFRRIKSRGNNQEQNNFLRTDFSSFLSSLIEERLIGDLIPKERTLNQNMAQFREFYTKILNKLEHEISGQTQEQENQERRRQIEELMNRGGSSPQPIRTPEEEKFIINYNKSISNLTEAINRFLNQDRRENNFLPIHINTIVQLLNPIHSNLRQFVELANINLDSEQITPLEIYIRDVQRNSLNYISNSGAEALNTLLMNLRYVGERLNSIRTDI